MSDKANIISLLERFLAGSMSSEEVLAAWPQSEGTESNLMFNCWDAVYDYNVDSDIRAKDPRYEGILRKNLNELLVHLKDEE